MIILPLKTIIRREKMKWRRQIHNHRSKMILRRKKRLMAQNQMTRRRKNNLNLKYKKKFLRRIKIIISTTVCNHMKIQLSKGHH
jgi:hypothetical protein